MDSTWLERDLPVLEKIVELWDKNLGNVRVRDLKVDDLDEQSVIRACLALSSQYINVAHPASPWEGTTRIAEVTPEAREITGQWPSNR